MRYEAALKSLRTEFCRLGETVGVVVFATLAAAVFIGDHSLIIGIQSVFQLLLEFIQACCSPAPRLYL